MTVTIDGTNGVTTPDVEVSSGGSASAPAITVSGDTNTGIFFPAADTIAFAEGGAEAMRINSSGNLLVGTTTSPSSSDVQEILAKSGNTFLQFTRTASTIGGAAIGTIGDAFLIYTHTGNVGSETYTERARITSDGDLLVGTTTAVSNCPLVISRASGIVRNRIQSGSLGNGDAVAVNCAATGANREAEIAVFKHAGITNPAAVLYLQEEDGANTWYWTGNDGNFRTSTDFNNIGTNNGTVVGTQSSDERIKNISGQVSYGLNEVVALEPIAFSFKDRPDFQKLGFSAQQVQSIVPEAVYDTGDCIDGYDVDPENKLLQTPKSDRTKLAMEYTQLIPVLVNAVKELKAINDAQASRIETLEAKVAALEAGNV